MWIPIINDTLKAFVVQHWCPEMFDLTHTNPFSQDKRPRKTSLEIPKLKDKFNNDRL